MIVSSGESPEIINKKKNLEKRKSNNREIYFLTVIASKARQSLLDDRVACWRLPRFARNDVKKLCALCTSAVKP
jgi:hypothetical protein